MPDTDAFLSDIGLISRVTTLFELGLRDDQLFRAKQEAEKAFIENRECMAKIRCELGAHTKAMGRGEIVLFKDGAAFIPVPRDGYGTMDVTPEFSVPCGLKYLAQK